MSPLERTHRARAAVAKLERRIARNEKILATLKERLAKGRQQEQEARDRLFAVMLTAADRGESMKELAVCCEPVTWTEALVDPDAD